MYKVSGYDGYRVTTKPFTVFNPQGKKLKPHVVTDVSTRHPSVIMRKNGRVRRLSVVTVACLAFHKQPPPDKQRGYFSGTDVSKLLPKNTRWVSISKYNMLNKSTVSPYTKMEVVEMYNSTELSQREVGKHFGLSRAQVRKYIEHHRRGESFF